MFDLVGRVRRRRRILRVTLTLALVVVGRRCVLGLLLLGLLVGVPVVPVVSNHRSSDERPSPGPSPESHEESPSRSSGLPVDQSCTVLRVGGTDLIPQG
jgi:hypothetical protein